MNVDELVSLQRFEKLCCRSRVLASPRMPCGDPLGWMYITRIFFLTFSHTPHPFVLSQVSQHLCPAWSESHPHLTSTMGNTLHDVESSSAKLSSEVPHIGGKPASALSDGHAVPSEFDADGEVKQDGVRRTEAITSVWNKKTLVFVFVT